MNKPGKWNDRREQKGWNRIFPDEVSFSGSKTPGESFSRLMPCESSGQFNGTADAFQISAQFRATLITLVSLFGQGSVDNRLQLRRIHVAELGKPGRRLHQDLHHGFSGVSTFGMAACR